MVLNQIVEVKINSHNIKYYKNVNLNDIIQVDIKNLHSNSLKIKVKVICDDCGEECEINLLSHTICVKLKGRYICKKCVKNKIINTNMKKYGVKYYFFDYNIYNYHQ